MLLTTAKKFCTGHMGWKIIGRKTGHDFAICKYQLKILYSPFLPLTMLLAIVKNFVQAILEWRKTGHDFDPEPSILLATVQTFCRGHMGLEKNSTGFFMLIAK